MELLRGKGMHLGQGEASPSYRTRASTFLAEDVLALAAQYYAEQQGSFSESELLDAGAQANIPPELIQRAIQEIGAQKKQSAVLAQVRRENRRLLLGLAGGLLAVAGGMSLVSYNALVAADARVEAAWAQVENQMQRRADLLPTLLLIAQTGDQPNPALVKALQRAARSSQGSLTAEQKMAASQEVDGAVASFNTAVFPTASLGGRQPARQADLQNLQYELTGTANRLAVERMRFNQAVDAYNRTIRQFPNSLIAKAMGMQKRRFAEP